MTDYKMCKICAYKGEEDSEMKCPNCHNKSMVKTSDPVELKRKDLLKEGEDES